MDFFRSVHGIITKCNVAAAVVAYAKIANIARKFASGTISATIMKNGIKKFKTLLKLLKKSFDYNLKLIANPEDKAAIEGMGKCIGEAAIIMVNRKPILM